MSIFFGTPSQKSGSTMDLLRESLYGYRSATGKSVTTNTATRVAAVFAVCRVLGEGVAQVPLKLMRESMDAKQRKTRLPATDHSLYHLLNTSPNDFQTSFEYREMMVWHCVLAGGHFSFINRGPRGQILELLPFQPHQVTVKRDEKWRLTYEVTSDDGMSARIFPAEAIWHVRGPSWDGWNGLECVKLARDAIGLAMATEEAAAKLHRNGISPSGVYSVEGTLSDDQYKALAKWMLDNAGSENAGKPLIMDRAAKWMQTSMSGVDAQSLETRRFQIEEICRFARVSPIMVYGSDKASTYAGSSANFLSHLTHTLAPWYARLEQSMDKNLLTEAERVGGMYFNHVEEGLMRANMVETKDVLLGYVNGGIMVANEARDKLDMNPIDDDAADELRIPVNVVQASDPVVDIPSDGVQDE